MKYQTKQTLSIYWQHVKKYRWLVLAILISDIAWGIGTMLMPVYYKKFFDLISTTSPAVSGDRLHDLWSVIITIIVLSLVVRFVIRRLTDLASTALRPRVMEDIGNTCFAYLHKHSFTFFNNAFVGSLVKQVNYFIRGFEVISERIISQVIPLIIEVAMVLVVFSLRDYRLGLLAGGWLALFLTVSLLISRYRYRFIVERSAAESNATGVLADTITNNVNVKLFCGYNPERSLYQKAIGNVRRLRQITWRLSVLFDAIQGFLTTALEAVMLFLSFHLWRQGILTVGDFALIQGYLFRLFARVWDFGGVVRDFYESLGDAEDMTLILTTPHEISDSPNAKPLVVTNGAILLDDVTFNYHETRPILSHFDLRIHAKEKVALVGPSGAGKSTIVKLLLRMHDTTAGHISIDNQSITRVTQESLWGAISYVPQYPILFHRTLKENIRYGKPGASDEEVVVAARLAHCDEFIAGFSKGYDTFVGERGVKLSGGERQRVAIARAILRNAPILILDEATSSLDSESERLIQDALTTLMADKTVIVIAHRLSTIMKMDRIVVVNDGIIVEQGSHAKLLQKSTGLYARLWQIQAGGFLME